MAAPYNGTAVGTPTYTSTGVPAAFGQALVLNGTTQYVSLTANPPPVGKPISGTPFTWDVRLKTSTVAAQIAVVALVGAGGYTFIGVDGAGKAWWQLTGTNLGQTTVISDGAWHTLRLSYDGTKCYAFLDGTLINAGGTICTVFSGSLTASVIGADWASGAPTALWNGQLDEVAFYSSCLTTTSYTPATVPVLPTAANLQALYHFDGTANDSAGSSISASPTTISTGSAGNVIAVTGTTTSFSGSPFTLSGGTGASITSQTVNDTTHASVTITAGSSPGTLTLTDTGSGASTAITVATATTGVLVCKGDSLTYGTNASSGQGTVTGTVYPALLAGYVGALWVTQNLGISGEQLSTMIPARAAEIDPLYDGTKSNNVLVIFGGTNDIGGEGASASTTYGRLVTYCQAIKAAHPWKIVVVTPTPANYPAMGSATFDTLMAAYVALIRAGWQTFADGLADIHADTRLSDETNTTYFSSSDQVHLTDAGYAIVAAYVAAAVNSAINYAPVAGGGGFLLSSPYSGGF